MLPVIDVKNLHNRRQGGQKRRGMTKGGDRDKSGSWSGLESDTRRELVGKPDKSSSGHCQACKSRGKPWGKVHYLFWSSVSASQPTWKETESGLVLASQQGAVAQTMTHGHVPTPNNIILAPLLKHFMSRNILSYHGHPVVEATCERRCVSNKYSAVITSLWLFHGGRWAFPRGPLYTQPKLYCSNFCLVLNVGKRKRWTNCWAFPLHLLP